MFWATTKKPNLLCMIVLCYRHGLLKLHAIPSQRNTAWTPKGKTQLHNNQPYHFSLVDNREKKLPHPNHSPTLKPESRSCDYSDLHLFHGQHQTLNIEIYSILFTAWTPKGEIGKTQLHNSQSWYIASFSGLIDRLHGSPPSDNAARTLPPKAKL